MQNWAKPELRSSDLGDVRLNRRLTEIVDRRGPSSAARGECAQGEWRLGKDEGGVSVVG